MYRKTRSAINVLAEVLKPKTNRDQLPTARALAVAVSKSLAVPQYMRLFRTPLWKDSRARLEDAMVNSVEYYAKKVKNVQPRPAE